MSMIVREDRASDAKAYFTYDQRAVIKQTLCPGISDEQLDLFAHVCARCKLDPFIKQIYAIMRNEKQKDGTYKDKVTIQTSIDGLRLIADRTGKYIPGRESVYHYDSNNRLIKATSFVKKQAADGSWHEVAASALFSEFKPAYFNNFWDRMPHVMLSKVAEAQALKKAFPAEMCGLLTDDEMDQADVKPLYNATESAASIPCNSKPVRICISQQQADEMRDLVVVTDKKVADAAWARCLKLGCENWEDLTPEIYNSCKKYMLENPKKDAPRSMDEVAQQEQEGRAE